MKRRTLLGNAALVGLGLSSHTARADTPGVTATEIRIGHTVPYSGPGSAYGSIGRALTAFWKMINDQGGIGGRKITFISYDDGYVAAKTVEMVRRLVEQDEVAFMLNPLGTANNTAIQKYMNTRKIPHLFISTGAEKWADPEHFPWTIGFGPSYRTEAQIYARYIRATKPGTKIGLIYQNDDFGKDYVAGLRDVFGADYSKTVVKEVSYETTDPTVDSQVVSLQSSGADALVGAATPKFAAQLIRKVYDVGWRPLFCLSNVSASVASVMNPAGAEKGVGVVTSAYLKEPTDPTWKDDPGMNEWRAFMKRWMPDSDLADAAYAFGFGVGLTCAQTLRQCGTDFSRENIMRQATNLHRLELPVLLPGVYIDTSPTQYHPMRQMQLQRWTGTTWKLFGDVLQAGAT
jgi:branched-chain amino acid transport system substrate-binding protein